MFQPASFNNPPTEDRNLIRFHVPKFLTGEDYDYFLENGWYRHGPYFSRSRLLPYQKEVYDLINCRLNLKDYALTKKLRKASRKCSEAFTYTITPLRLDTGKELLYQQKKPTCIGFISRNLHQFLYGEGQYLPYKTYQVEVYEGEKLIAFSLFDIGDKSIASLLFAGNPDYRKYELGYYTMALEINFAQKMGKQAYYPGYIIEKDFLSDYKNKIGELEFMQVSGVWQKMETEAEYLSISNAIGQKLALLKESLLAKEKIASTEFLYPYFSIGYINQMPLQLLKAPTFLKLQTGYYKEYIIYFEYERSIYILAGVKEFEDFGVSDKMEISPEYNDARYSLELLELKEVVFATSYAREMVEFVSDQHFL